MIARLDHLRQHPSVFRSLTGVTVGGVRRRGGGCPPGPGRCRVRPPRPARPAAGGRGRAPVRSRPDRSGPAGCGVAAGLPDARPAGLPVRGVRDSRPADPRPGPPGPGEGREGHDADARPRQARPAEPAGPAEGHPGVGRPGGHVRATDPPAQAAAAGVLLREEAAAYGQEPGRSGRGVRAGGPRPAERPPGRPPTSRCGRGPGCSGACRRVAGWSGTRRTPGRRRSAPGWCVQRPGGSRWGSPARPRTGGTTGRCRGGG